MANVALHQSRALIQGQHIDASRWAVMRDQAAMLVKSGFLPSGIRTPEQALSIMMLGSELDVPPWGALSTINVIQGKPTVSPQLMLGLIERSKQAEQIDIKGDDHACVVTMKRRGRAPHTTTFTMEDAQKLGLAGKDNYQKQPGVMLQWRAVAACARVCFPDVILGLFTPDEMGADVVFTDTGEMVLAEKLDDRGEIVPGPSALPSSAFARDWQPESDTETGAISPLTAGNAAIPIEDAARLHGVVDDDVPTEKDKADYATWMREADKANIRADERGDDQPFDMKKWDAKVTITGARIRELTTTIKQSVEDYKATEPQPVRLSS